MSLPQARKYVSGIAIHWYGDIFLPQKVLSLALTLTHNLYPNLFLLGTEACEGLLKTSFKKIKPLFYNVYTSLIHIIGFPRLPIPNEFRNPVLLGAWERLETISSDIFIVKLKIEASLLFF